MISTRRCIFLLFICLSFGCQNKEDGLLGVNWKDYMSRQDPVFDQLNEKWADGAFVGNGLLGLMVYKANDNALRFEVGRSDVTDHRPRFGSYYGKNRLPVGHFNLKPVGEIQDIHLRMDLWDAEIRGTIKTDQGEIELQSLALAQKDVMMIRASTTGREKNFSWQWKPEKSASPRLQRDDDPPEGYKPNPEPVISAEDNMHFSVQHLLAGGGYATAWKEKQKDSGRTIFLTVSNTPESDYSKSEARELLNTTNVSDVGQLIDQHRDMWHKFYKRSFISVPDSRLQSFWWIQQYKMRSATREGGRAIDLMGPWYRNTPWPKYWWNLNTQLTYYPFISSNRIDLMKPLFKAINRNFDNSNLRDNVPEPYRHNAITLGRSSAIDMVRSVKVMKNNDGESSPSSLEMGDLPWLLNVYWKAYRYSMDKELEKNLYPILRANINYYIDVLKKGEDGKLHLPYSYSPEYPGGITRDCNYDLALLRWGAKTLLQMNEDLGKQDSLATKWQSVLDNLTPYPTNENGLMVGADVPFAKSHRHYSHLLMIYPLHLVNWDNPEDRPLIKRSLHHWQSMTKAWRGYSYSGSASIHATMGHGEEAKSRLDTLMDGYVRASTMYTEAGPVIETPLSAVTTMNELLLQSWGGIIRIFPSVPSDWKDVSFYNLRASGAFLVSASRKDGKTQFVRVKSLAGSPCVIKTDLGEAMKIRGLPDSTVEHGSDHTVTLDLKKGEEAILYNENYHGDFKIHAVKTHGNKHNDWGLKKPKDISKNE